MHKNQALGLWVHPDKKMMEQCPIIPIEQHHIYYNGVDAELLEEMYDHQSSKFVVDFAMCYEELWIIVEKTPAETCINKFHRTCSICDALKRLQLTFLGPSFTQLCTGKLKEELCSLKYKGEFRV